MASRKSTKITKTKSTSAPKPSKPVFRAGTLIALAVFAAIAMLAYFLSHSAEEIADADITPTVEAAFVFNTSSLVKSIEVSSELTEPVKVERNAENVWMVTLPNEIEADPALVEAAVSQIASLKINDEIEGDPSIFGLDQPAYIITIEFEDGTKNILEVGDSTPTNNGYYVRLNQEKMMILSLSGIDSLINLADFPPYLYTPTPTATATPLPTETPVPAIEATPTP
ncbi:MAG: DUF4340 domain-containing protein [Anaerolineales bacterium]|nr:DUF4340 domain-containing protein [Anaerolineales bacterium]